MGDNGWQAGKDHEQLGNLACNFLGLKVSFYIQV